MLPARRVAWLVAVLVLLAVPLYVSSSWLRVGEFVMIGAVGAIGLTLLTGQAGQLSLGTPFFMLVGGTAYCVLAGRSTGLAAAARRRRRRAHRRRVRPGVRTRGGSRRGHLPGGGDAVAGLPRPLPRAVAVPADRRHLEREDPGGAVGVRFRPHRRRAGDLVARGPDA